MSDITDNTKTESREPPSFLEGGFRCLVIAARILGLPADYEQLVRAYPAGDYPDLALLRAARQQKSKDITAYRQDVTEGGD